MGKEKSKKRRQSTTSELSSSSSSSSSDKKQKLKKLKKKIKKEKRKQEKLIRKRIKEDKKKLKERRSSEMSPDDDCGKIIHNSANIPIALMEKSKAMAPMTKEEWDKKQSVVRRVLDEESGRYRLIKGDGEVLEEIVSRDRQRLLSGQDC